MTRDPKSDHCIHIEAPWPYGTLRIPAVHDAEFIVFLDKNISSCSSKLDFQRVVVVSDESVSVSIVETTFHFKRGPQKVQLCCGHILSL